MLFGYAWGTDIARVAPYTNLYSVAPWVLTDSIEPQLAELAANGMQALVALGPIVCNPVTGLRVSNWSARLDQWKAAQGAAIDARVAALYLPDEPYHLGWTGTQLKQVSARVKTLWPNQKQMLIEGYQRVRKLGTTSFPIPPAVNYVGFDRYGTLEPLTDPDYAADYNALKARLGGRKMVVVAEAQWSDLHESYYPENFGKGVELMGPEFDEYYEVSKRPEVGALIIYPWPNGFDGPGTIGAEGMPQSVIDRHVIAGREITGK